MQEKPKRGRPKKVVEETALAIPDAEPPEPPKLQRARKKPDPERSIQSGVAFTSKRGEVSFKAMRAPPKNPQPKAESTRPYASLHDRYNPDSSFVNA